MRLEVEFTKECKTSYSPSSFLHEWVGVPDCQTARERKHHGTRIPAPRLLARRKEKQSHPGKKSLRSGLSLLHRSTCLCSCYRDNSFQKKESFGLLETHRRKRYVLVSINSNWAPSQPFRRLKRKFLIPMTFSFSRLLLHK
jgi:hypothetical protein